ncbi:head-specific guanylate cyclase isoform X1 [Daktulosphaira vitifoliae]|uniref:head-specific guanylate cyclase isoform X1 n=1 Tax=Daktulosphaira vitifoliae TaxID=58002 RepID=UPI0021A9ECD5|nr:head-specific guanylate cyclase isoform X1 [Daktulosphaira vitifoliae]XP_050538436.1 head-specific guanylate cyclase isoform X1 [Daktulosphaira vitifoliae]
MFCPFSSGAPPRASTTLTEQQPLNLKHLSEAVRTLTSPPNETIYNAFSSITADFPEYAEILKELPNNFTSSDVRLLEIIHLKAENLTGDGTKVIEAIGTKVIQDCSDDRLIRALKSLGGNLYHFLTTLDGVQDVLQLDDGKKASSDFTCRPSDEPGVLDLNLRTSRSDGKCVAHLLAGTLSGVATRFYGSRPDVELGTHPSDPSLYRYTIRTTNVTTDTDVINKSIQSLSQQASDLKIGVTSFCKAFPWHLVLDIRLEFVQLGTGFMKLFGKCLQQFGRSVHTYFKIKRPRNVRLSFKGIVNRANSPFVLTLCLPEPLNHHTVEGLEFKGQMVLCNESGSLLFVGSPLLDGLDSLTSRSLFISDIPLHDATRDVILIGEQARAQDGLRRRMDKLKSSIEEANLAVGKEREKNVSLLHMIFPPNIAKRLWLGETIEAKTHDEVTMLFSDIVGFTSICSTATPFMVVNMLECLYNKFDAYCGHLDIYKVETIGDAYCVASGLHKYSSIHAQQIAWMALKMIETCKTHHTHDGKPIKMRIGLHTGSILAGVVGVKMPRYCLFGHNVTIANKFESGSEPLRINVSPTTHQLLMKTPGFSFEERSRSCLPAGFPEHIPGTCHFLLSFVHPEMTNEDGDLDAHISTALKQLTLNS